MAVLELNAKEKAVVKVLRSGRPLTIQDIARRVFKKKGHTSRTKGNSWVRNSLRRPVRLGLVRQVGKGTYAYAAAKDTDTRREATA